MKPDLPASKPVLVWDAPVRVFHALMVIAFAGAYATAESERYRLVHVTLGYTLAGLIVFRLVWGLVGTRHARFAEFVRGPRAAWRYLRSVLRGCPEEHTGHNPAGALAIVALLALGALTVLSGWANYADLGGEWLEDLHEGAANTMLAVVLMHVVGVVVGSVVHRENLVRAMISGRRPAPAAQGIGRAWRSVAVLLLLGVLGFWWLQWEQAPPAIADARPAIGEQGAGDARAHRAKAERRHHEHD